MHVVSHCLGALSFSMALSAGTVTGVTSLVGNSVSLTPRMPAWSKAKLRFGPPLIEYVLGPCQLDPRYGSAPVLTRGWLISKAVAPFHRECRRARLPHAELHVGRRAADLHCTRRCRRPRHARLADLAARATSTTTGTSTRW